MWDTAEVFIFTPSGISSLPKSEIDKSLIVYFDIPIDVRINRLEERSDADAISRRIESDNADFRDFNEFDIKVTNPEFDCDKLLKIVLMGMKIC
jgi:guanylate kinase